MQKTNSILRYLSFMIFSFLTTQLSAQIGLNFQGVARTSNNIIIASQPITLKLSILQGSATGNTDYVETRRVVTNAQGLFNVVIGDTGAISAIGDFPSISWKNTPKFLKIEMDPTAGSNFITMGATQFQYVAYAEFAKSVDAESIVGIVPVSLGGTGVNSLTNLKTALAIDKINNTADLIKPISVLTQTALDLKLNAIDTNKFIKQAYLDSALLTKLNSGSIVLSATSALSANTAISATTATSAVSAGTASTATKLATARNINGVPFDGSGDITITASTSGIVTNAINATTASSATVAGNITATVNTTLTSLSNLASVGTITTGIWSGTAIALEKGGTGAITASDARTNLGLVIGTNVQAPLTAGTDYLTPTGSAIGLTNFPILNQNTTGNAATATLAATAAIANTATSATNALNATTASLATIAGNITATANTTLTSLSNLATVGTITTGIWSATTIALEKGGTGAITASAARTNLGLVIGTNVQAPLTAGTDYLTPTGSALGLTNFPVLNQNTTGKAATATTATTAGNITATSNTTLSSLSNLATVGIITTGTWRGGTIALDKGGTGLTSAGISGQILTSTASGTLTCTTPSTGSSTSHTIGESYGGGIVFYVYDNGNHGLIASTYDQCSSCTWSVTYSSMIYAIRDGINGGKSNTDRIILNQGAGYFAASTVNYFFGDNYADWYLPSKYELNLLYLQKSKVGVFNELYWASTEVGTNEACFQSFYTGLQYSGAKYGTYNVRAIRSF